MTKTGDTASADNSNFYGVNAIVLASGSSTITLTDCTLTSAADGANGAFAYEEGSSVTVSGSTITTTGDNSRGVDATYGGKITISDSTISTSGAHSGALATDRYESSDAPQIIASNVTGTTAGEGSPGIYCTGTFTVSDCTLTANGSEAAAIEGLNSITLTDSDITGYKKWGVIVYQSTSGDSTVGTGTFDMTGGSLTNNSTGPDFMVCNTSAVINIDSITLNSGSSGVLLRACDASSGDDNINEDWGTLGGDVEFTATGMTLDGTISCDELSTINVYLVNSTFTGSTVIEDGGEVNITTSSSSKWYATSDSYVNSLNGIVFSGRTPTNVDAAKGVTITVGTATTINSKALRTNSSYKLSSGGTLKIY